MRRVQAMPQPCEFFHVNGQNADARKSWQGIIPCVAHNKRVSGEFYAGCARGKCQRPRGIGHGLRAGGRTRAGQCPRPRLRPLSRPRLRASCTPVARLSVATCAGSTVLLSRTYRVKGFCTRIPACAHGRRTYAHRSRPRWSATALCCCPLDASLYCCGC